MTRTIKSCATQRGSEPPSRTLVPCNLYRVRLQFICVDFGVVLLRQTFLQLQNAGNPRSALSFSLCPSLFQRRRWVSLWTHSSTVTRSTSRLFTGEGWECVEVNTAYCCWLDAVWTAVTALVHTRSLCEWLSYQNVWQKVECYFSCTGMRTLCVPDDRILVQKHLQLFIFS
jgi:hypothetical protein